MLNSATPQEPKAAPSESLHERELDPIDLRLGDYQLGEKLGHGGMGVVYRARQLGLGRAVAVKLLLLGRHSSADSIRRFQREARAVASLRHPNIVSIFEVGEADGQHYFSMELVEGEDLAQRLRQGPLSARDAAECLRTLALAVEYAHSQGVLHRDLKPSNVLIDVFGQPRLTDFGLAKPLDGSADLTETGRLLGSPNYLAPECVSGGSEAASPASDVYSLGALFYELLTGRPPFLAQSLQDTLVRIRDTEPVSLRRLNPTLPADLETVCLKCLEKSPGARYPTAQTLADDLGRWLRNEPIQARPVPAWERSWKWSRRNPRMAALALVCVLAGMGLFVTLTLANVRIRQANDRTAAEAEASRLRLVRLNVQTGNRLVADQDPLTALGWFVEALALEHGDPVREDLHRRRLGILLRQAPQLEQFWTQGTFVDDVRLSPDQSRVAATSQDGRATLWEVSSGRPLAETTNTYRIRFSPDSRFLLTFGPRLGNRLWNVQGELVTGWPKLPHSLARFSADTRFLALFTAQGIAQYDPSTGQAGVILKSPASVPGLEYSPDGQWLLGFGSRSNTFVAWSLKDGVEPRWLINSDGTVTASTISPDGRRFAALVDRRYIRQWDLTTGESAVPDVVSDSDVLSFVYSPDGQRLATAEWGGAATQWDAHTGQRIGPPLLHGGGVKEVRYSPDGQLLATASWDTTVRFWEARSGRPRSPVLRHGGFVTSLDLSTDGQRLVTGSQDTLVRLWHLPPRSPFSQVLIHPGLAVCARFSPDSTRIVVGCGDGHARVWNRKSGELLLTLPHRGAVNDVRFSSDGRWILTGSGDGTGRIWEATTGAPRFPEVSHGNAVQEVRFSPGGHQFATLGHTTVRLWESATGRPVTAPLDAGEPLHTLAFHPDGRRVLLGSIHGVVQVWDLPTASALPWRIELGAHVSSASYSPDGCRVITSATDLGQLPSAAQVWNSETGQRVLNPLGHLDGISWAEFSPDGRRVATASEDNSARVWDATTGEPLTPPLRHRARVLQAAFSPDGRLVATAGEDQTVRIWETETGEAVTPPLEHEDAVKWVVWSPNGRELISGGWSNPARIFDLSPTEETVERLRLRAELLASQRLNPTSGASTLTAAELRQRWDALHSPAESRKKTSTDP